MTLVAAFISSNWVAILALLTTFATGVVAFVTKKSSDAKVAQANQKAAEAQVAAAQAQTQTAETRDVAAQANAKAAQAGAQAVKERSDVEADTAGKSDAAVRDELRAWVQPDSPGASAATGAGANADR
jgi:hypothetical protein